MVFPMVSRLLPSLDGCVEMEAVKRRTSFQRRPSCLSRVWEYVERVSRGMLRRGAVGGWAGGDKVCYDARVIRVILAV